MIRRGPTWLPLLRHWDLSRAGRWSSLEARERVRTTTFLLKPSRRDRKPQSFLEKRRPGSGLPWKKRVSKGSKRYRIWVRLYGKPSGHPPREVWSFSPRPVPAGTCTQTTRREGKISKNGSRPWRRGD